MADRKRKPIHIFASILCTARSDRGMTQQEVADHLCCSRRWYQKIEAGMARPNWQDTILLMELFELDVATLAKEVGFHVPVSSR